MEQLKAYDKLSKDLRVKALDVSNAVSNAGFVLIEWDIDEYGYLTETYARRSDNSQKIEIQYDFK